jgi:hypothetical protein
MRRGDASSAHAMLSSALKLDPNSVAIMCDLAGMPFPVSFGMVSQYARYKNICICMCTYVCTLLNEQADELLSLHACANVAGARTLPSISVHALLC